MCTKSQLLNFPFAQKKKQQLSGPSAHSFGPVEGGNNLNKQIFKMSNVQGWVEVEALKLLMR